MAKAGKIEQFNLGPKILHLGGEGKTSYEIAEYLKDEGFTISQATIARWIKKQREEHSPQVQDIVADHVAKVVPQDLDALEVMEAKCLAWAGEEPAGRAERISNWVRVRNAMMMIREDIMGLDARNATETVDRFVRMVIGWIMEDINTQKSRIGAMRMATSIIDTKLKYSGILLGQAGGNIIIEPDGVEQNDGDDGDEPKDRRLYLVQDKQGKEHG